MLFVLVCVVKHVLTIFLTWHVSYKRQELLILPEYLGSLPIFGGVSVAHLFNFLCRVAFCVFLVFVQCLVCQMLPVSCVPNVASVFVLSSSCVLCAKCCQCFVCQMLPVSLYCLFLMVPSINVYLLYFVLLLNNIQNIQKLYLVYLLSILTTKFIPACFIVFWTL